MLKYSITPRSIRIEDSYKAFSDYEMQFVLDTIRLENISQSYTILSLSDKTLKNEWKAHNLLYSLGIAKDRTKDVDLTINSLPIRITYSILANIWEIFNFITILYMSSYLGSWLALFRETLE